MDIRRLVPASLLALALAIGGAACTDDDDGGGTSDTAPTVGPVGDDTIPIGDPEETETGDDGPDSNSDSEGEDDPNANNDTGGDTDTDTDTDTEG